MYFVPFQTLCTLCPGGGDTKTISLGAKAGCKDRARREQRLGMKGAKAIEGAKAEQEGSKGWV